MNITKCVSSVSYKVSGQKMLSEFVPISQAFRTHFYRDVFLTDVSLEPPSLKFGHSQDNWLTQVKLVLLWSVLFPPSVFASQPWVFQVKAWQTRHTCNTEILRVRAPHHSHSWRFSFPLRCCIVFSVSLLCRRKDAPLSVTSTRASCSPVEHRQRDPRAWTSMSPSVRYCGRGPARCSAGRWAVVRSGMGFSSRWSETPRKGNHLLPWLLPLPLVAACPC